MRAAFDDYQRRRVDITGRTLDFDPEALTADAEWVKHNLARVQIGPDIRAMPGPAAIRRRPDPRRRRQ